VGVDTGQQLVVTTVTVKTIYKATGVQAVNMGIINVYA
jgi:hypothetical protein